MDYKVDYNDYQDYNKKNWAKWLKALRSGRYPQTTGKLYRPYDSEHGKEGYCCLGVAAKISRAGKFDEENVLVYNACVFRDKGWDENEGDTYAEGFLTRGVCKWLGIFNDSNIYLDLGENPQGKHLATYRYGEHVMSATDLNDNAKLTLPQIADMLEYFIYNHIPDSDTAENGNDVHAK